MSATVAIEGDRLPSGVLLATINLKDYAFHSLAIQATCLRCGHQTLVHRGALIGRFGDLYSFDRERLTSVLAPQLSCIRCGLRGPQLGFVIDQD